MARKWGGKKCPACGQGKLHESVRPFATEYRGEKFSAMQAGAYCDNCDDGIVYDDPAFDQAWDDFRAKVDREQAAELATYRKNLGITQEVASRLSGGGHNAFSRYERQEAQPVMAVINLFRLLDRHPMLVRELIPGFATAQPISATTLSSSWLYITDFVLNVGPVSPLEAPIITRDIATFSEAAKTRTLFFSYRDEDEDDEKLIPHLVSIPRTQPPRLTSIRPKRPQRKPA